MKPGSYEIEIKSLLGNRENAALLETRMKAMDTAMTKAAAHRQLNHYFEGKGDFNAVAQVIQSDEDKKTFTELAAKAKDLSLRTRDADGKVLLVLKASIDDTTSANGTARREFEKQVNLSLEKLDEAILKAGFSYQAKWSRERVEYGFSGINVVIDKNAGYGYLAEFEMITQDPAQAESAKTKLRELIKKLGFEELDQKRLARMFDYYNTHWREYYGTEKIFVIE